MIDKFNIRVYGLYIREGKVLITDEFRLGIPMTKFPGGGLQFGEGIIDCLHREFMEELSMTISRQEHYYTTEYYQPSELLAKDEQLISIYYKVYTELPLKISTTERKFDFEEKDGAQTFRWVVLKNLDPEEFTFPIDKLVAERLKDESLKQPAHA